MTNFLLRLFVKNSDNTTDLSVRSAIGKLAGTVGILCNLLLFGVKLACGILVGSVSILADAINNLSDAGASIITLLGFHLAQRPADRNHPYGHARYEYLSGLAVSAMILMIGLELGLTSVRRILHPAPLDFTLVTFGILLATIGIKYWMARFFKALGQKISSSALTAASLDSRNDFIATAAVLLGCLISRNFHLNVDGIIGLGVAVFIFYSGIKVANETISPLLGKQPDQQLIEDISKLILRHDKILGIHDLLIHDYGPGQCFASVHAELNAEEDPLESHEIIDDIECDALTLLNVHLVIHYDPVVTNDSEWNEMHQMLDRIIHNLDPRLSMHDFRMVRSTAQPKLVFDLAVPYSMKSSPQEIKLAIYEQLLSQGKPYPVVIHFDSVP